MYFRFFRLDVQKKNDQFCAKKNGMATSFVQKRMEYDTSYEQQYLFISTMGDATKTGWNLSFPYGTRSACFWKAKNLSLRSE